MPTFIEKTHVKPVETQTTFTNVATDSSARKFITPDSIENNSPTDSTSNVEHMVIAAAGVKSLALSANNLAAIARQQILATQQALLDTTAEADQDARSKQGQYTESDVNTNQKDVSKAAAQSFLNVQDPNIRAQLQRQAQLFVLNSRLMALPIREAGAQTRIVNQVVPELETVTIDIDARSSVVDNFSAVLLFNLPSSSTGKIRSIRIFRAAIDKPIFTRPLATLSSAGIDRLLAYRGRKNQDNASVAEIRHTENNVVNAIDNLNFIDPYTNLRQSADGGQGVSNPPALAGQPANPSFTDSQIPTGLQHLDASVLENINVLANMQRNPNSGFDIQIYPQPIGVGDNLNTGLRLGYSQNVQVREFVSKTMTVVEAGNKLDFQEIAFLTTDKLKGRRIQDRVEYTFVDQSVSYGKGYKYFITTVDDNMIQSQRSEIATVTVEAMRVPERPSTVVPHIEQTSISLSITAGDQLIEKFEVYRYEYDLNRTLSSSAITIADTDGYSVRHYNRSISSNNYLLLGECANAAFGGAEFIDIGVKQGNFYTYRVYAVDIFGNKSESPMQVDAYVPDLQQQYTYLQKPAILVENDAASKLMVITFSCDDSNVEKLQLERRDLTIGQDSFSIPTSPPRVQFGLTNVVKARKFLGEVMSDNSGDIYKWNGVFVNRATQQIRFIDPAVQFDHIYQYRIYGEDRYGNRSPYAVSSPLLLSRRPFINAPLGVSASLVTDADYNITGVSIKWNEANLDVAAEELIGDQAALLNSHVRTMYSVQRKKKEEDTWQVFSLITGSQLDDTVSTTPAPNFRPPYLSLNQTYLYRIQAVQTGAFLSNFTTPIEVFVGFNVSAPENFTLRTPDVYLKPFYVMLNWDTQKNTGIVDHWEIERSDVNNYAAARLNLKNQEEFSKLVFKSFRKVYRESSRFSGKVQDPAFANTQKIDQAIITGQHCFMDTQIDFGNSYFYRIRAVSPEGSKSAWTYKGIKITSSIFEHKWLSILTDDEKQTLSQSMVPMMFSKGMRKTPKSSISMQPDFSKPNSQRTVPRVDVVPSKDQ